MTETFSIRILLPDDADTLMAFARGRLAGGDAMEAEMASWTARWRVESLAHYLPQGWCFGAFAADGRPRGFVLAQPFLFHRGLTQTLWVETLEFDDVTVAKALIDVVYRWSRDKHLQCVLVESTPATQFVLETWPSARVVDGSLVELKTARF